MWMPVSKQLLNRQKSDIKKIRCANTMSQSIVTAFNVWVFKIVQENNQGQKTSTEGFKK